MSPVPLRWLSRLLKLQAGEERSGALMLAHSFAMGLSTVYFETAASALFLERFGSSALPAMYLVAAVVNIATGFGYANLKDRVPFRSLMLGTLAFLLASVVLLRAGLALSGAAGLVFSLLVFYRVLSALTDLEYWAVAGHLYDVRQAKRLFGIIGTGEVVARILGSFSIAFLVGSLGVRNLLVLSGAALLACLAIVSTLLRAGEAGSRPPQGEAREGEGAGVVRSFLELVGRPYIALLFSITAFAVLAKYFVDYAFLEQVRGRYPDARGVASFLGVFNGVTQLLSLAVRLLGSGPLLDRFGIRAGLLLLPLAHAANTLLLVLAGAGTPGAAVFALVIANQGLYKVLKHPIDNPSFKVLYQPLRQQDRLAAQIAVETMITPLTVGLAGFVMLLFTFLIPYDPALFGCVMLAGFGGWVVVALRAGQGYADALLEALSGRFVDSTALSFDDDRSKAILQQRLSSPRAEEVLFVMDLLEKTDSNRLAPALPGLLDHASDDVRRSAVERIERMEIRSAQPRLQQLLRSETSPRVRAATLSCLCTFGGAGMLEHVAPFLDDPDPQIRRAVMVGLLRGAGTEEASFALAQLIVQARSERPADRIWVAQVIAEVGGSGFQRALLKLLKDPDPGVLRAALMAAGRARDPSFWPLLVEHLASRRSAGAAAFALVAAGESALPAIEAGFDRSRDRALQVRLARVLGRIRSERSVQLLKRRLGFPSETVRQEVLAALRQQGWQAEEAERDVVLLRLRAELDDAVWTLAARRDLGDDPQVVLLARALDREWQRSRERIFLLLSFIHDPVAISRAEAHLADPSKEKRAYAREVLDVTVGREMLALLAPLLDEAPLEVQCERLGLPSLGRQARLRELLSRPDELLTPWSRACAIHAAVALGGQELADAIDRASRGAGTLVGSTAAWASLVLRKGAEVFGPTGGRMLTIERVIVLKAVEIFAGTSEEVLVDVASILEEVECAAGQTIFEKGAQGDSMYVIVEGAVRIHDGDRTLAVLGDSDIFGELALLDPEPRMASAAAVRATRLFRLDRDAFLELMGSNIDIVRGVLHVLCERLRELTRRVGPYTGTGSTGSIAAVRPTPAPPRG